MAVREHSDPAGLSSAGLRVVELRPGDLRWQRYVSKHAEALPYHYPRWSQVLQETFGYRPAALGCVTDSGQLTGVLPLMEKRSLLAGVYLSSLPCTPFAGPCADDPASTRILLAGAAERVDSSSARWLQVKSVGSALGGPIAGFSQVAWDPSYVLDLPANASLIRLGNSRNHGNVLRLIRSARRQGVTVREATSLQDVRRWYRLYLETVRYHAIPPRPFRLFEVMWQVLEPQSRRLLLAENRAGGHAELLAGCLFLFGSRTVACGFNGRDRSQLGLRPNEAIHWKAINDACVAGLSRYDFGEVEPGNHGLARFKRKWGAYPVETCRSQYPPRRELERGLLGPSKFRTIAQRAWRRMPLPATGCLGGWIYRHL